MAAACASMRTTRRPRRKRQGRRPWRRVVASSPPGNGSGRVETVIILSFPGLVAQLVEQRTENPCVGGSIPPQATIFFCFDFESCFQNQDRRRIAVAATNSNPCS